MPAGFRRHLVGKTLKKCWLEIEKKIFHIIIIIIIYSHKNEKCRTQGVNYLLKTLIVNNKSNS